ncbi:MAG: class B sortase [Oscillospiraceae bacterium]|jgi:SrtB family sortase|nr:class B sortase [Oscillospiraceae bacterium]
MAKKRRNIESADALDAVEAVIRSAPKGRQNFFEANLIPLKGDSKKTRRRKLILDSCFCIIFICSLVILWVGVIDPARNAGLGDELIGHTLAPVVTTQPPSTSKGQTTTAAPPKQHMDYAKLKAINDEYVGWLRVPGANIDTPLVQTENNNYYLYRNFKREPSRYGNPFLDYRVGMDPISTNLIVYGHHMSNGKIFTKLLNYQQLDTVKKSPIITLELKDRVLQYKVMAVFVINGRREHDNGYVFAANTPEFPNKKSFDGFVRQLQQRTFIQTGVDVQWGDSLISLQTCIYDFKDEYLYVVGRLVRPGESASVPADQIKKNPDPRMPQKLCDVRGYANHYRNAERWEAPGA